MSVWRLLLSRCPPHGRRSFLMNAVEAVKNYPGKMNKKTQQLGLLPNLQCTSTQPQMDQRQKSTIESKNKVLCKFAKKNSV